MPLPARILGVVAAVAACVLLLHALPGRTPAAVTRRLHGHVESTASPERRLDAHGDHKKSDDDGHKKSDDDDQKKSDDNSIYLIREKTVCVGQAYTDGLKDKDTKCNGWFGLTAAQCRHKCTNNEQAPGCPKKKCFAAVIYPEKTGSYCHLFEQQQCSLTARAAIGKPTTFQKNMWKVEAGMTCAGDSYTDARGDKKSSCNGWGGLTPGQCRDKCAASAKAPHCPQEKCAASVHYPIDKTHPNDVGWCHLYTMDQCDTRTKHIHASTSMIDAKKLEAAMTRPLAIVERFKTVCAGHAYTDVHGKCNGWSGLTKEQCKSKCVANEKAPGEGCPQKQCFAAGFFDQGKTSWCHLFDRKQCSMTSVAAVGKPITFQKNVWNFKMNAVCAGKSYTEPRDKKDKCNGWGGLTEWECRDRCAASAQAPGCPQKKCYASVHFPSGKGGTGWCHLYTREECAKTAGTIDGHASLSWLSDTLLEEEETPADLDDNGRYLVREKVVCGGKAYTEDRDKKCNGWLQLSRAECRDKCTNNEQAPNCPKKKCFAAVHYGDKAFHGTERKGWCHLFTRDACSLTRESAVGKPTTFQTNIWIVQPDTQCSGHSYTDSKEKGKKDACNGWAGLTEGECRDKCAANAKAPNCPDKKCYASVHYPSSVADGKGWCHLFTKDQCSETEAASDAQSSTSQLNDFKQEADKVCNGRAYTDEKDKKHSKCNGFGFLTKAECMDKCRVDAQAPHCPKKNCFAAVYYPWLKSDKGWCHLFTKDECSKTQVEEGKHTLTKESHLVLA